jgi:hypothetical protein
MNARLLLPVALVLASLLSAQTTRPATITPPDAWNPDRAPRAAIFRVAGFPTADAPAIDDATMAEALKDLPVDVLASEEAINAKLKLRDYDVLVLPYGSAFPLGAWPAIRAFIEKGGGLVVLGGAPFHQPVRWDSEKWVLGPRQPTYAHELLIGPAEMIDVRDTNNAVFGWFPQAVFLEPPTQVFTLTVRFTTKKDFEKEDGTAGPRDAILRPLVHLVSKDGWTIGCPLLEIDRIRGSEAGARWVFGPCNGSLTVACITACVKRALDGAEEVDARPVHASVRLGETPVMRATRTKPRVRDGAPPSPTVWMSSEEPASRPGIQRRWTVDMKRGSAFQDSAYVVRDDALLASGPKLTVSRDWIRKDGKVFPIIGTTYMASDVHRKFLFEPNPAAWDRDFAEMKKLGINFVRTGLWTAWTRAMLDSGAVDEGVLRALEAYVQIAASHGIHVCFNFFAFQPPMFGGTNPYLDPRALEGQKALLVAVASRFKGCNWVHWDLINEPSYSPADQLWTNRPIGDEWEKRAWTEWVIRNHGNDPLVLRDRWRDASADPMSLPGRDELAWTMIRDHRRPRKAMDFARFTQDVVARWAADLRETLRAASGAETLVTLGQDEGGTHVRPAQQLYAPSVDYTSVHTWWNNDDLLWDGVVTKVPEKPSLIQETGLMRLEDIDGMPWRSPEDAAKLLERKTGYSFMSRGCGAVEWAWNVNPYMPIDNESVIGLIRPDGTMKPEALVLQSFARFFEKAAPFLEDFEPDEVVMIIPHSKIFAGRPRAVDGTRRVVRLLSDHLGVVPTAISEYAVTAERLAGAKLVIVPTPEMLDPKAHEALRAHARSHLVVVTGPPTQDPYGLAPPPAERAVAGREPTAWGAPDGKTGWVTFDGGESEWLKRGLGESGPASLHHEPLPLDLAREPGPMLGLLRAATEQAKVTTHPSDAPVAARVLLAPKAALVIVANESSADARRRITVGGVAWEVPCPAGRARLALIDRNGNELIASTEGDPVTKAK